MLEHITRTPTGTPHKTPLLFVHGAWHGAWCWDEFFLPYFAENGYTAHALSLSGHPQSPRNKHMVLHNIRDYVADVAQIADKIEQESGVRPVIIGHSMGGYITQKYLETYKAPAAVLIASIPVMGTLPYQMRLLLHDTIPFLKAMLTLSALPFVTTPQMTQKHFFSPSMPKAQVEKYHAQMCDESLYILVDAGILNRPNPKQINATPMFVIAAEKDAVFTLKEQYATATAYHAPIKTYPNMAHDMMLEAGWRYVADDIVAWLAKQNL